MKRLAIIAWLFLLSPKAIGQQTVYMVATEPDSVRSIAHASLHEIEIISNTLHLSASQKKSAVKALIEYKTADSLRVKNANAGYDAYFANKKALDSNLKTIFSPHQYQQYQAMPSIDYVKHAK